MFLDQPIRYWQQYSEDCFEGSGGSRRASSMSRNVSDDGASEMKSTSTTMVSNGWDNFPVSTKAVSKPSHSNNFMATSSTDTATSVISKPQNGAGSKRFSYWNFWVTSGRIIFLACN